MNTSKSFEKITALAGGIFLSMGVLSAQSFYTAGHGDIGLGEGTELEPHVHLGSGSLVDGIGLGDEAEFEPDEIIIFVSDASSAYINGEGGRPEATEWNKIGVGEGEDFWFLPESNLGAGSASDLGVPFLGIGGEEIELGTFDGNEISFTLSSAVMPTGGAFSLWNNGGFGPSFAMTTVGGISSADSITLDLDVSDHAHFNWGFSKAGQYDLTFEVSALEGGSPVSALGTYTFLVSIPEPSSAALLLGLGSLGFVLRRRR